MKTKYTQLFLILILALGMLLVACGGAEPETAVQEPAAEAPAEEAVVEEQPTEAPPTEVPPTEEPEPEPVEEVVEEPAEADLDTAFNAFLADMDHYNTIGIEALATALAEGEVFLLDVRQPGELEENGWIEGAVNIPLREVADNIEYLPSQDTPIVSYCGSGWRCTIALAALEGMGWEDVKGPQRRQLRRLG